MDRAGWKQPGRKGLPAWEVCKNVCSCDNLGREHNELKEKYENNEVSDTEWEDHKNLLQEKCSWTDSLVKKCTDQNLCCSEYKNCTSISVWRWLKTYYVIV